jgi:glutamate--cysteine ligase
MPNPAPTLSVDLLRSDLHAREFRAGARDRVGVEVELIPFASRDDRFDLDGALEGVDRLWAEVTGSPSDLQANWDGIELTREPGGQLEFNTPPVDDPEEAARIVAGAVRELRARALRDGHDLMAVGLHPWASVEAVGLRTPRPRYQAMQRYFDSLGPEGRRMMRLTASIQVCVDHGDSDEARERWELAQRLAPVLTAAFAHSAVTDGRAADWRSLRGRAWLALDPERTGIPAGFLTDPAGDPVEQYLAFALDAPVMFVIGSDGRHDVPSARLPFRTWMLEGHPAGYPDLADWRTHLSTLFPDVRPRGYLECRAIDVPGRAWLGVPVLVVSHALRSGPTRRRLLELLRPHHTDLPDLRVRAARDALADATLHNLALALFATVRSCLDGASAALVEAYADRYVRPGLTPADEARSLAEKGLLTPMAWDALEGARDPSSHLRESPAEDRVG